MTDIPIPADTIALLFDTDPTTLSDAKFIQLISEVRRRRSVFHSEEAAKALAPKRARAEKAPAPDALKSAALDKPATEIDLEDLV